MVVSPLWRGLGNISGWTRIGYSSNTNYARRFRCEDISVYLMHVQPHYYRVRPVEPCHLVKQPGALMSLYIGEEYKGVLSIRVERMLVWNWISVGQLFPVKRPSK